MLWQNIEKKTAAVISAQEHAIFMYMTRAAIVWPLA
jgi:hypothetical protein